MRGYASILSFTIVMSWIVSAPGPLQAQLQGAVTPARTLFVEGRDLWDDGKFADAEKKFREALTKYPRAEQSDRTAYYLITTLIKLNRPGEARTEIQNFYRNYPASTWKTDVDEKRLSLDGLPSTQWGQNQLGVRGPGARGVQRGFAPNGPFHQNVAIPMPPFAAPIVVTTPSWEQEILRLIIEQDLNEGIRISTERLKGNPADPAVAANLTTIASANSPKVLTFLVTVAGNTASPTNFRTEAIYFMGRQNDRNVGSAFIEVMKATESISVVADALSHFGTTERRRTLNQIAQSPNAQRTVVLESLYKASPNPQVRSEVVESVGSIPEPSTIHFLSDVAQNEKEPQVRNVAIQTLIKRPDTPVKTLEVIMRALPRPVPPPRP